MNIMEIIFAGVVVVGITVLVGYVVKWLYRSGVENNKKYKRITTAIQNSPGLSEFEKAILINQERVIRSLHY